MKSSSLFIIKKVLKDVPLSRLNSSSNLSIFSSKNLKKHFWQKTIVDLGIRRFGGYHAVDLVESFRMS